MATGSNQFFRYRYTESEQLERDLKRVYAEKKGCPPRGLDREDVAKALNGFSRSPWKERNDGEGLKGSDLSELRKQSSFGELHAIKPKTKVRTCFPNLRVTRNYATTRHVSICDAVAKALDEGGQARSYEAVVSARRRYKKRPIL